MQLLNAIFNLNLDTKNSDGDQTDLPSKNNEPRLQRSRAQSRKIFRFRQSRRMEVIKSHFIKKKIKSVLLLYFIFDGKFLKTFKNLNDSIFLTT